MRSALLLLVAVMLMLASCGESDVLTTPPFPNTNTGIVAAELNLAEGDASLYIPAGTTITSNAIRANGNIPFSVGILPESVRATFTGTYFGGAAFGPADATLSQLAQISIPVSNATGALSVYRYILTSTSQVPGWEHVGNAMVINGVATLKTGRLGYFIAGSDQPVLNPPTAPIDLSASDGEFDDKIQLTWTASPLAGGYYIYRDTIANPIASIGVSSLWDDLLNTHDQGGAQTLSVKLPAVSDLEEHTYWIQAFNNDGLSPLSNSDTGFVGEHNQGSGGDA